MRSLTLSRLLALVLFCGPEMGITFSLGAQQSELRQGDVARVSAKSPPLTRFVGRVVALTTDTMVIESDQPQARIGIPRSAITVVEVRSGVASRTGHALAGAALGLIGGATL